MVIPYGIFLMTVKNNEKKTKNKIVYSIYSIDIVAGLLQPRQPRLAALAGQQPL